MSLYPGPIIAVVFGMFMIGLIMAFYIQNDRDGKKVDIIDHFLLGFAVFIGCLMIYAGMVMM